MNAQISAKYSVMSETTEGRSEELAAIASAINAELGTSITAYELNSQIMRS